jgi:fructose/tagatose bisphosphate aldolase
MLVGAQHDEGEEGGGYSKGGVYTHPGEAVQFVKLTGVDSLAVAIGNSRRLQIQRRAAPDSNV